MNPNYMHPRFTFKKNLDTFNTKNDVQQCDVAIKFETSFPWPRKTQL